MLKWLYICYWFDEKVLYLLGIGKVVRGVNIVCFVWILSILLFSLVFLFEGMCILGGVLVNEKMKKLV